MKICDIVSESRYGQSNSVPLPDNVKTAFRELESCLMDILEAVVRYKNVRMGTLVLERSTLKEEATSCVRQIDTAVKVFQTKIIISTSVAVEQTHLTGEQTYLVVEQTRHTGEQTSQDVQKILTVVQKGLVSSSFLDLNVLPCPDSSQYFTGRESDLQNLSRMLAAPVVTLFGTNSNALSAFVHSFNPSSKFAPIFLDVSSVEALKRLKVIVPNIKADDNAHQPLLLVLENADPSLELDKYLPYSLHNPILITSIDQAVSHFASAQDYELKLTDSMDQWAADSLCQSIERAFTPLQHIITIVARGGTGKTQLVLKFVSENLSRFTHIWFFDATSDATLAADFKRLGKAVGIDESVDNVKDFLGKML
ncbi:hypothetical protein EDD18DRAFT_251327 [Armillaria luteobubalina]|uniref:NB-ARC domain-containing protein n=1 Tax=Armillaria luteobubalina TaxID=153913 RepID=A0AA39Q5S2_9AGAR|nr:hypothetical protein EDD18DRAFT_251327 [Armillaria luteobubalina]